MRPRFPIRRTRLAAALMLLAAAPAAGQPSDAELIRLPPPGDEAIQIDTPIGLTLAAAESRALAVSPSVSALAAEARAARWQAVQAGLNPNPTVGYTANEIGADGAAGQQGAYVSQRFVRGGKLGYASAVESREARRLEQEIAAERRRVLTDTRTAFYEAFLSQEQVDLARQLTQLSQSAAETSGQLFEAGEGPRTNSLQGQIEAGRADAARRRAEQRLLADWRRLAALTATPSDPVQQLAAKRDDLLRLADDWDTLLAETLAASPEVAERLAAISRARCQIAYQRSLAVPDVTAQLTVQYDDANQTTITSVQIGAPLLLYDRNQGGIGAAQAELTAATRRLDATQQALERRLAEALGRYQTARTTVEALRTEVLPRAQENLELATEGYQAGEIGFLDLLTAQRTYFEVSLELLDAFREVNASGQLIQGRLLAGAGGVQP
ncbi:TolC family protein [Botrimarina sp.]|uniref:TolC family protein n=1 Tax=Botrimarina sp. TaxID=2795802 RepID=UPI0032EB4E0E